MGSAKRESSGLEEDCTREDSGKKQRISFTNVNMILITVGPEKAKHYVHSPLLCEESGFFRAAINSGFKESSEQVIDLPGEKAEHLDNFIHWLYREKFPKLSAEIVNNTEYPKHDNDIIKSTDRLCYQFTFADKYDIPRLRKYVLLELIKLAHNCKAPSASMIVRYYEATVKKSPLRRLLCDWYTLRVGQKFFESDEYQEGFSQSPEWAVDLLAACARNWAAPPKQQVVAIMKADNYF
ncbi:MAG: hypothetical protein OHK93_007419 [Ramalina farinacea]|uniref:BTB domain-containing protein n=1 Tax=Ramalina farinacea TaxID=258253 RepID=A0AA43TVH9_9LECA|nr:hypothetical protein [Ramalina farinacea]